MRRYSYPPDEGTGKRPVRSAAAQSLREMGLVVRYQVLHLEARGESREMGTRRALVRGKRLEEGRVGQATKLRMDEAMRVRVEAMPLRSRSRCP